MKKVKLTFDEFKLQYARPKKKRIPKSFEGKISFDENGKAIFNIPEIRIQRYDSDEYYLDKISRIKKWSRELSEKDIHRLKNYAQNNGLWFNEKRKEIVLVDTYVDPETKIIVEEKERFKIYKVADTLYGICGNDLRNLSKLMKISYNIHKRIIPVFKNDKNLNKNTNIQMA